MKAYIYRAAPYCEDCAARIEHRLLPSLPATVNLDDESTYDSDQFPKGPYDNGGGEADSPQHCDECGTFLQNPLTKFGDETFRESVQLALVPPGTRELSWSEIADLADEERPELAEPIRFYFCDGQ